MFQTLPLFAPLATELQAVTEKLHSVSHLQDERLDQALRAIVGASGKLIRPAVAVTVTKMYAADPTKSTALAASVEMLHTATLVHDDMIDGANQRRGNPTLHTILNPASAVLLGDFLFAQAAEWAAQTESVRILHIFAAALMDLVGGELRQMWAKRDLHRSEQNYYDRIYGKTAALFAAACEGGAVLGDAPEGEARALREYGRLLGLAFQVVDDVLDFAGDEERLGKPVGGDVRGGNVTLPLIRYLHHSAEDELAQAFVQGNPLADEEVAILVRRVVASPAIEESLNEARRLAAEATGALAAVRSHQYCNILLELAEYVVRRQH